ncbi:signal peptidase I [Nanchangia anserum]|uniref:Signal peptidase I n=1 Tax=Nanchangia anserum TaxID=2692125 RepID=A0A8I0G8B1_9ACTO|nr:signal peptidase I [Nanchangia anserum]MBD3688994.1 signal peptidase I [Nanchangia anserum]QOX81242.1 signal peptidase I [Nanchangia anserum]
MRSTGEHEGATKRRGRGRRERGPARAGVVTTLRDIVMTIVVAIIISALLKTFLIQSFVIPSESMRDTLEVRDRILVSKLVPAHSALNRGDIIVFEDHENWLPAELRPQPTSSPVLRFLTLVGLRPDDSSGYLAKRVIGLPGDTVECCDSAGRVSVNGQPIDETYLRSGVAPSETTFAVTVPEGKLWVMGDNRPFSLDSRAHRDEEGRGFIAIDDVVGRAFVIVWPLERWTRLSHTDVFDRVPDPASQQ